MLISPNNNFLPCIYNTHRNISQASEDTYEYRNDQHVVFKRNYSFQRSYLHISPDDTKTNIYNITNKVEPLKKILWGCLLIFMPESPLQKLPF